MSSFGKYCFDAEVFSAEDFNVGRFLEECRLHNPMETVHQDLKDFQTVLENQLVSIINEDYAEFLQLSTKLKGVDEAVSSVRSPILAILKRVDQVQQAMVQLEATIQKQLQLGSELQKQEQDLILSIRVMERLTLLEKLLEVPVHHDDLDMDPADDKFSAKDDDDDFDNFEEIQASQEGASSAEVCARLERAAQNLIQLELEFFEGVEIPSIQRTEKRIAVVEESLLRRLETELATEVFPDTFYNRDHSISAVSLSYLLRAYVLLQKTQIPEDMIARLLVQPFAEENLTRGKLDGKARGSCEGLARIYESILSFVDKKFKSILMLPVCRGSPKCSVDILGNAIWKPLQAIISSKLNLIFKAADPDRFHHNYSISMKFLRDLEQFCPDEATKMRFRAHESTIEFKEKWNMDVYFQVRVNQLSSVLEESFDKGKVDQVAEVTHAPQLIFHNSRALLKSLRNCWDDDIFIAPLLPGFTKLCTQLLAFFIATWKDPLVSTVEQVVTGTKGGFPSTPIPLLANEEDIFCAANDMHMLMSKLESEISLTVQEKVAQYTDDPAAFTQSLFQEPLRELSALEDKCWSVAVFLVAEDCKKVLPALRTVKGQYQMTNKPPPTTPSTYTSNIVRPLADFLAKWGAHFTSEKKQSWMGAVLEDVCTVYLSLSSELLKSALELEESLKSRKLQRNASANLLGKDNVSDTEKMRIQLHLDLEEVGRCTHPLQLKMTAAEHAGAIALWKWGIAVTMAGLSLWKITELIAGYAITGCPRRFAKKRRAYPHGFAGLVGNTPLIELKSLSVATGCTILAKAEFLNPGGSSKDRVAKGIVEDAERRGLLKEGGAIVEGTSGSTGISLSLMACARGYDCVIVMPDDQAKEKSMLLEKFGAQVELVKPASIVNSKHYVNEARRRAKAIPGGYFANQFENTANFDIHYRMTGPEIWKQTNGEVDAFVMSSGTGGTIAGVSSYLKEQNPNVRVFLADPPGSSLYNKVRSNVCYTPQQAEKTVRRHRYDTIAEGVGIDRLTENFLLAQIDDAFQATDQEIVEMSRFLLRNEGVFVGSSSALNCVAAVRAARKLGPGHVVVTVLCDSGQRHLTKFWDEEHIREQWNLEAKARDLSFLDGSTGQP
ncbi:TPA: hypothetical protein N0F65_007221 [Lagenidium giganteum]|uniref:Conserved oligomeric Golgi complex subunit 2 n=1 Tax=Lagenidium giganteum TaxID=4803 RepID=A0AAV2Z9U5_9STRA|nr:TPA: hypothetical protein N0F65_007221 [Lagenidium giganteum]